MATLANLIVKLTTDIAQYEKQFEKAHKTAAKFAKNLTTIGGDITNAGKTMSMAITAPVVAGFGASILAASDMNETVSKSEVVFGAAAKAVKDFTATASTSLGVTQQQALASAANFGNLFVSMEMGQGEAARMSMDLVKLAADLASFNNLDPTEVMEKLQSGMVGQTEPLRSLGVNMSAATVEAKALEMGYKKVNGVLPESALLAARYAVIMQQTKTAQGDFARTSDGLANSMRIIKAQLGDIAVSIGNLLLPYVVQFAGWMKDLIGKFQGLSPETQKWIVIIAGIAAAIGPILMVVGSLITAISAIIPVVAAVVGAISGPVLAVVAIIAAAAALIYLAWTNNWGGIREKTAAILQGIVDFWNNVLLPGIQNVIKIIVGYWNQVLLPALLAAWKWMNDVLFPFIGAIAEVIGAVLGVAVKALAGLWQKVLMPALIEVWKYLDANVMPIIREVAGWVGEKLTPAFNWLSEAIKKATEWFGGLADKIRNIKLPDWLTPGSPTPLEMGIWGINRAMARLNQATLPDFTAGLRLAPVGIPEIATIKGGANEGEAALIADAVRRMGRPATAQEIAIAVRDAVMKIGNL